MNNSPRSLSVKAVATRAALYVALCTVAVAQPLLQLYGSSVAVFATANYEGAIVVVFGLVVLLAPALAFLLIDILAEVLAPRIAPWVHRILILLGSWAVVSVIFRSISVGPWILDLVWSGALGVAITWAINKQATVKSWVTYMSPLSIIVAVVFVMSASSVIAPPEATVLAIEKSAVVTSKTATPQDKVSVVWIVLDEAPLWPLLTTTGEINARRYPGFAALAESSTWYRNVLGTSQTTTDAVPAMLTGMWPQTGTAPVLVKHPKNLFTLMNGHLAMDAHEVATALCPKKVCNKVSVTGGDNIAYPNGVDTSVSESTVPAVEELVADSRTPFTSFLRDAVVVFGHKVLPRGLRTRLPPIDEGWGGFGAVDAENFEGSNPTQVTGSTTTLALTKETKERANSTSVKEWESGGPMSQIPVLDGVIRRAARADRATLHFAHVLTPHRPWMLTPDMRRSRALSTDKRSNTIVDRVRDQYQAHLMQYVATDNMIAKLVFDLKQSANWNRTMVIVTADHGVSFELGESKRAKINVNNPGTLEDIYRIPLFIKYPDQLVGEMNDCPVSSVDIFPTIVATTGVDAGWKVDGFNLKKTCPVRPSRTIIWPEGSHDLNTTFADIVKRAQRYDEWIDAEGDAQDIVRTGSFGEVINGSVIVANAPDVTGLKWTIKNRQDFSAISESTYLANGEFGFVPAQIEGTISTVQDFAADAEGVLVFNGVAVGLVSELAGLQSGESTSFRSTLNWNYLHGPPVGAGLEMWVVQGANATRNFSRVTSP